MNGDAMAGATDPATLEIVGKYLVASVREMGVTLMRTAYSTILRESMDCTTALFDPRGQLVAQADHVPSHQGTLSYAAKHVLREMTLDPGDVVILNHPYLGGTHHPDIMIFKPVFHGDRLVALAGALGHHIDVGGRSPGSVATDARDVFEEGLMIPPLKLYRGGREVPELIEMIRHNIRVPEKTLGDIRAEIAAVTVGERRFLELVERYGAAPLGAIIDACLDRSERLMREDLARLPDGTWRAVGHLDHDGVDRDRPVRIEVAVTLDHGAVTVDFGGSSAQVKGPFNCSASSVQAATFCAVRYMASAEIMQNEGCYRPIQIVAPEASIVNPVAPAPLSGRFHTLERIANTIVMAFNGARGERAVGSTHGHMSSYSMSGERPGERRFVCFEILGGGWGGHRTGDGMDATFGLMANCYDTPIEALELEYPLRVERYELTTDSGGPGEHRGGMGLSRAVRYLGAGGRLTNRSDATRFAPAGVNGGLPGASSRQTLTRAGANAPELLDCKLTNAEIGPGDLLVMDTAGGGGLGDPMTRDPQAVLADVLDGKVSVSAARDHYGVVLDASGSGLDEAGTAALRRNAPRRDHPSADTVR